MEKNMIIGQSGGPTAVINASLYGAVCEAFKHKDVFDNIYGMINGIEGFLNDRIMNMEPIRQSGELELLKTTPGSFLGSCRYKLPEDLNNTIYQELFEKFKTYNIRYFFYIGGNDSMDTVSKLSRYAILIHSDIRFIGLPKTIDNDLIFTDHTPGFGSAAKYIASTVREISLDACVYDTKKSVTIIEIMGRHTGWLTASAVLARKYKNDNPRLIYLPEVAFDQEKFISEVSEALETTPNLVVCISEGIKTQNGTFVCELNEKVQVDTFGHKMLTGSGKYLENLIQKRLNIKVRSIELNVAQRCSTTMVSGSDQNEAIDSGSFGVTSAINGETGKMIAFRRTSSENSKGGYSIDYITEDVNKICNKEKLFPAEWISGSGSDVTNDFLSYVSPLIRGSISIPYDENGLPKFAYRK